ncbi:hypothetical protein K402DRAFT_34496 [Aulographum hederae CBS 113979]|uniref:Uncharacterized protein n=1 Tax=Aulographum hederae CBS 113979 TaxID=1176131 RepID=A0A6G1H597_9PEZI|nr:hypothetical protein K402DRAFT_34496 [Aulographum hederae CBS 113979]
MRPIRRWLLIMEEGSRSSPVFSPPAPSCLLSNFPPVFLCLHPPSLPPFASHCSPISILIIRSQRFGSVTMPLTERDPNISGRNSRASNLSAASKSAYRQNGQQKSDLLSVGVMSMLKTSTELGGLGAIDIGPSRTPVGSSRQNPRRSGGNTSRISVSSAHSHNSSTFPRSNHHQRPSAASSGPRRGSLTSTLNVPPMPDGPFPSFSDYSGPPPAMPPPIHPKHGGRSYSMTNSVHQSPYALSNARSLSSLRNHEHVPRPRSPYHYPTRLKRPGYRPSSPALSDVTGLQPTRAYMTTMGPRMRPAFNSPLGGEDPRMPMGGYMPHMSHIPYMHPHARSTPSVDAIPRGPGNARYHGTRSRSSSVRSRSNSGSPVEYVHPHRPGQHRETRQSTPSIGPTEADSSSPMTPPPLPAEVMLERIRIKQVERVSDVVEPSGEQANGPMYYDYTEQFDLSAVPKPLSPSVPMGFVNRIKTILEERATIENVAGIPAPATTPPVMAELPASDVPELPATPVVKRITRDMVLSALDPDTEELPVGDQDPEEQSDDEDEEVPVNRSRANSAITSKSRDSTAAVSNSGRAQGSIYSDAQSETTMTSSRVAAMDLAMRYSQPVSRSSEEVQSDDFLPDGSPRVSYDHSSPSETQGETNASNMRTSTFSRFTTESRLRPDSGYERPLSGVTSTQDLPDNLPRSSVLSGRTAWSFGDAGTRAGSAAEDAVRFDFSQSTPPQEHQRPSSYSDPLETPVAVMVTDPTVTMSEVGTPDTQVGSSNRDPSPIQQVTPASRDRESTARLVWTPQQSSQDTSSQSLSFGHASTLRESPSRDNSTTDLRFSALRPGNGYLPDVKEEDENSRGDLRLDRYKFPLPRSSSDRASLPEVRLSQDGSRRSVFRSGNSLADTRAIPSFNFSRMNLFAKLNEAFSSRSSRSLDLPTDLDIAMPVPERPSSSGLMRDKYKSFFASLEEMEKSTEDHHKLNEVPRSSMSRPLSPQEYISEVDKVDVPSIQGLTQRLSELIPSLRRFYDADPAEEESVKEEDETPTPHSINEKAVQHTIDEIRGLGKGTTPRPSTELPESSTEAAPGKEKGVVRKSVERITPIAELEAPVPAHIRVTGPGEEEIELVKPVPNFSRPGAQMRVSGSPKESRPWNYDASYPWNESMPSIHISLPHSVHREGGRLTPSRLRIRMSDGSSHASDSEASERTSLHAGSEPTDTDDTFTNHKRRGSKRYSLLSMSRALQLTGSGGHARIDNSGFANSPNRMASDERSHDPGDRYPTTGLAPPGGFNVDEVRSFFSDDSSHRERGGIFRKRLTHLKSRMPPMARAYSAMDRRSVDRDVATSEAKARKGGSVPNNVGLAGPESGSLQAFEGSSGMPRMEFRARKLVERIKVLWFKSGELVRTLSGRARRGSQGPEALEESTMYSGT